MKFPLAKFETFCSRLVIDSKEHGQIRLGTLLGTQRQALKEIVSGLEDDKHFFVILKARQLGVTTITLALDLFWHWMYAGMQGTLAADSDRNVAGFRTTLNMFVAGLPTTHKVPMMENNRMQMSFKNRSRLQFQVGGGSRRKGQGGRGMAITYLHGTECSSWSDEESLASILASLAEKNDRRLHIFESTARGFNLFHDMWETAKDSVTQHAIFIGWWHNEFYSLPDHDKVYKTYWGVNGKLTAEERELCRTVYLKYGYEISPNQIAWYRWKLAEVIKDERLMAQEYPWHDDQAFVTSGSQFFSASRLQEIDKDIELKEMPDYYRFGFGSAFEHTQVEECNEKQAILSVWEQPDKRGIYAIGADPAYGSSDWADRFAIQVFRCYADKIVQVAEFATPNLNTYQFAWVLCYIAGFYGNSMINLEVNGPGMAVLAEMDHLKRHAGTIPGGQMSQFLNSARSYLYKRLDAMGGGFVKHWKCLSLDTPLPTPTGWITMGEIETGDVLLDEAGNICTVIEAHPVLYGHECYRITFDDGTSIIADADHLWPIENGQLSKTFMLGEGMKITLSAPWQQQQNHLPIDPYLLGAWLGDGFSASGIICGEETDLVELTSYLDRPVAHWARDPRNRTCRATINGLKSDLKQLGLLKNKCIPMEYLRGSFKQRLELLQGLMDTDGSISARRQCSFTTTNPHIFHGFKELLRTLGIKVKYCIRNRTLMYKGEDVECAQAYQFTFTAYPDMPVFKLKRKLARQSEDIERTMRPRQSKSHIVISVEPVESVPVRCIEVDSRSHLYLAGEGMIPTHNTTRDTKERMLNIFKDHVERGECVINSAELVNECRSIERDDGFLGAPDRKKDDRVISAGLAVEAWYTHLRLNLSMSGETYENSRKRHDKEKEQGTLIDSPLQGTVLNFLKARGIKR